MSLLSNAKEAVLSNILAVCSAAITALLLWFLTLIDKSVLYKAIVEAVPAQSLLPLLLLSLLLNLILLYFLYLATQKSEPELQLRYGIYWDKQHNPFCPVCQKPVAYDDWGIGGVGYYCQPCKKVTPLKDSLGKELKPSQVFD